MEIYFEYNPKIFEGQKVIILNTNELIPYSSVSGVCSALFNSSIHPALCSASSKLNKPVFKMSLESILQKLDSIILTKGLIFLLQNVKPL